LLHYNTISIKKNNLNFGICTNIEQQFPVEMPVYVMASHYPSPCTWMSSQKRKREFCLLYVMQKI